MRLTPRLDRPRDAIETWLIGLVACQLSSAEGQDFLILPKPTTTPHVSPSPPPSARPRYSIMQQGISLSNRVSLNTRHTEGREPGYIFAYIRVDSNKYTQYVIHCVQHLYLACLPTRLQPFKHFVAYTHSESCTASSISTHSPFYMSSYQNGALSTRNATHLRIRRQVAPQPHALAPVDRVRTPLNAGRGQRRRVRVLPKLDRAEALEEAHEHERDLVVRELHAER